MSQGLTLYVCHIDAGGPPPHACKGAQRAMRASGHDFDKVIAWARDRAPAEPAPERQQSLTGCDPG